MHDTHHRGILTRGLKTNGEPECRLVYRRHVAPHGPAENSTPQKGFPFGESASAKIVENHAQIESGVDILTNKVPCLDDIKAIQSDLGIGLPDTSRKNAFHVSRVEVNAKHEAQVAEGMRGGAGNDVARG
jgi:hypothetical protein